MHSKYQSKILFDEFIILFFCSFPLILCMEIQCSISQQERIAQLLIEIFGEKLHLSISNDRNLNGYRTLPSPNDLRRKIIIKVN